MYYVSAHGVDERIRNIHNYYHNHCLRLNIMKLKVYTHQVKQIKVLRFGFPLKRFQSSVFHIFKTTVTVIRQPLLNEVGKKRFHIIGHRVSPKVSVAAFTSNAVSVYRLFHYITPIPLKTMETHVIVCLGLPFTPENVCA